MMFLTQLIADLSNLTDMQIFIFGNLFFFIGVLEGLVSWKIMDIWNISYDNRKE